MSILKDPDMPLKENDDTMDETRYALNFYETTYGYRFKNSLSHT